MSCGLGQFEDHYASPDEDLETKFVTGVPGYMLFEHLCEFPICLLRRESQVSILTCRRLRFTSRLPRRPLCVPYTPDLSLRSIQANPLRLVLHQTP